MSLCATENRLVCPYKHDFMIFFLEQINILIPALEESLSKTESYTKLKKKTDKTKTRYNQLFDRCSWQNMRETHTGTKPQTSRLLQLQRCWQRLGPDLNQLHPDCLTPSPQQLPVFLLEQCALLLYKRHRFINHLRRGLDKIMFKNPIIPNEPHSPTDLTN